jgi:hypothetical protein
VPPPDLAGRPAWLAPLPDFLFRDADAPFYILKAFALSFLGSLVLAAVAGALMPDAQPPPLPEPGRRLLLLAVFFAPVVETALMIPPLLLLARFAGPGPAVAASAVGWGVIHSLSAPTWGLVIWWPFLIFSIAFLTWRGQGLLRAGALAAAIHALQNAAAVALMIVTPAPPAA